MSSEKEILISGVFDRDFDLKRRVLYLTDEFESQSVSKYIKAIHILENINDQDILVFINSPGGDVYQGLALYEALRASRCVIKTFGTGLVASMAAAVFLAGQERFISPLARYLTHAGKSSMDGDVDDLKSNLVEHQHLEDTVNKIYAERTLKKSKAFWAKFKKDKYFSPEECVKLGIAHYITSYPEEA